jgi:inosine-uridine nucleoside N-ribohydrolase
MKISHWMVLALGVGLAAAALSNALGQSASTTANTNAQSKPPADSELVLLDTDIGDDIDDAFALGLTLKSPEVELLGVTTTFGDTLLRARLVERFRDSVGSFKIDIAAGTKTNASNLFTQRAYADQHRLEKCSELASLPLAQRLVTSDLCDGPDTNHWDFAPTYILDQIRTHPGQITLIGIGPLFNVQAVIEKDPATFKQLKRVVIMGGSIDRGYDSATDNKRPPDAEWNIKCDPAGLRALLASGVPVYMMPLDSTQVRLSQHDLEKILAHGSPVTDQLALLYHQWVWGNDVRWTTPTLFDPVAVAYSIRPDLCPTTPMRIEVDDKGFTRRVDGAPNAQVCLKSDESGFRQLLLDRLTADGGQ